MPLAYFGYPRAHEDDAERAICAGLELTSSVSGLDIGTELAARVGIATGPVVVGDVIGEGASQESAVVGETPNLASRLQGVAAPATVAISDSTHALVHGLFDCVDLGRQRLKGFADEQRLWCVEGESQTEIRFEALRSRSLTPLVGRKSELSLLLERWETAARGEGQVVLLEGEPGIGKSRLADELRRAIGSTPHTTLRLQCSPHHTSSAFFPFAHHLQRAAGFLPQDDVDRRLDRLEAMLADSTPDRSRALWLCATLLSLPTERYTPLELEPQALKSETVEMFRGQLVTLSRTEPSLVVFEDVHWIDPTSLEVVDALVELVPSLPVLFVVTHRPEFDSPWDAHGFVTALRLNRLARRDGATIIREVSGGKSLPGDVTEQILAKTDGVALFIEELTRTVLETGLLREGAARYVLDGSTPELVVPPTLRDSLMARLDRLLSVKEVAQIAACIGHEFPYGLLRAVAGLSAPELQRALEQLADNQLIFRRGKPPDSTYTFKHALVQDVAYDSLLLARRRALHGSILSALEEAHQGELRQVIETLAHHARCGELWDRAAAYGRQAGAKAFARSSNREAVLHFEQALAALGRLPESRANAERAIDLRFDLRNSLLQLGEFQRAMAHLREAEGLARAFDDQERLGWASVYMSNMHVLMGSHADARAFADAAQVSAEKLTSFPLQTCASYYRGFASVAQGRYREAVGFLREVTQALEGERVGERLRLAGFPAAMARCFLPWALGEMGEFRRGVADGIEGVEIAAALDHPYSLIMTCWGLGHLYSVQGAFDLAVPVLRRGLDLVRERNIGVLMPYAARPLGHVYALTGRVAEGFDLLDQAVNTLESMGLGLFRPLTVAQLGEAALLGGDHALAMRNGRSALELARDQGERGHEAYALRLLGQVAARGNPPDFETTEGRYREAMALAVEMGMRPLVAHCHYALGRLYQRVSQAERAHKSVAAAAALYGELDMPFYTGKAQSVLQARAALNDDGQHR